MRVFMTWGKKILVINRGVVESYASIGSVEGSWLRYKDRETKIKEKNKVAKRLMIPAGESPFFRLFGVTCVQVDEKNSCFILPSATAQAGFDAIQQENLLMWALQRPRNEEKLQLLVILCLCASALALILCLILIFKLTQLTTLVQAGFDGLKQIQGVNLV